MSDFYFFCDRDELKNQSGITGYKTYGPVSGSETQKFRFSSLFTGSVNSNADVNAYAICPGQLLAQISADSTTINLLLKPKVQPGVHRLKVKYFVYRGLKLTDFLANSSATTLISDNASNSDLINLLYDEWDQSGNLPLSTLGFDITTSDMSDSDLIDSLFETRPESPFFLNSGGVALGRFDTTKDYGLDILLDNEWYYHTLGDLRSVDNVLDVGTNPSLPEGIDFYQKRETILAFADPAAYWGSFFDHSIKEVASSAVNSISGDDVYTNLVSKYQTKNRLYIDIRNEHGLSYNYYDNYRISSDSFVKLQIGFDSSAATTDFNSNRWPIHIVDRTSNSGSELEIKLRLAAGDNTDGTVYTPFNYLDDNGVGDGRKLFFRVTAEDSSVVNFTNEFSLKISNYSSGSNESPSALIRLDYGKNFDRNVYDEYYYFNAPITTNAYGISQYGMLDGLVFSFGVKASWKSDSGTIAAPPMQNGFHPVFWKQKPGEFYKGKDKQLGLLSTYSMMVANDIVGETVVYTNRKLHRHDAVDGISHYPADELGLPHQVRTPYMKIYSDHKYFFQVYMDFVRDAVNPANILSGVAELNDLDWQEFDFDYRNVELPNTQKIKMVVVESAYESALNEKLLEILSISFTYSEKQSIINLIAGYESYFPVFLSTGLPITDENPIDGQPYYQLDLKLTGLKSVSGALQLVTDDLSISAYSNDGMIYMTESYMQAIENDFFN